MAFDPATYQPGDAWTSPDFRIRAITAPRVTLTSAVVGDATPGSYFFTPMSNEDRFVDISINSSADCSVNLERSYDNGATWEVMKQYQGGKFYQESLPYTMFHMLRLKIVAATQPVTMRLFQQL